jgi:hypothetical protein
VEETSIWFWIAIAGGGACCLLLLSILSVAFVCHKKRNHDRVESDGDGSLATSINQLPDLASAREDNIYDQLPQNPSPTDSMRSNQYQDVSSIASNDAPQNHCNWTWFTLLFLLPKSF